MLLGLIDSEMVSIAISIINRVGNQKEDQSGGNQYRIGERKAPSKPKESTDHSNEVLCRQ
jgi:hypothetical protein